MLKNKHGWSGSGGNPFPHHSVRAEGRCQHSPQKPQKFPRT